ncbi:2'-deoxymugineic-acid 2'-dioxygenase [Sorghum bicolor]|uniref:Fe2OG dioxygenase domain-containing protein n=1 Tax=Sorghum bicolor TaxID=4558 RepID=C5YP34_SORBI|nr:2'-deoxymugineic-acid 2'-dioxygenase [Sorghum bicolor]EES16044.1 hypothetical protein SORBI_3008G109400 [Sorghum bicolor]|eukprot:XP_002442206.1 2'-deoxymugineic-acid 2'-dioxygenase [Sorghum bicolor]
MENLLHVTPSHLSLPNSYAVPQLPQAKATPTDISLPVIDLSRSRDEVCRAILDAGKEFGFFQVINHGIPEQVLQDMESVSEEFFQLPAADKAHFYSEDTNRPNRLFSGSTYKTSKRLYWMDCLRLARTFPGSDCKKEWPEKPEELRNVFENYTALMRGLGMEMLHMLCQSLGLPSDYFDEDQSAGDMILSVIRYPPCPTPDVTLGLPPHCDRNLITLVLSGSVPGLQVFYKGDWIMVKPIRHSFVINFGLHLEVVTNGIIKSVEHRVITNSVRARTSVVITINGTEDCLIGPADELLGENKPPRYRTVTLRDFMRIYNKSLENPDAAIKERMKPFMI